MRKHTLSDWHRDGRTVFALNVEGTNRFSAQVQGGWQTAGRLRTSDEELEANARLIASAPDSHEANVRMVDALNVAFRIMPGWDDERIYDELPTSAVASAYFAARAAIAKAVGP